MTGNVLINSNANRLSQFYVWNYGPGNASYYKFIYIDFAASKDKVYIFEKSLFYQSVVENKKAKNENKNYISHVYYASPESFTLTVTNMVNYKVYCSMLFLQEAAHDCYRDAMLQ